MVEPFSSTTEPEQQEQTTDRGPPAEVEERNAPEEANVHATRRHSGDSIGGGKASFDSASGKASMDSKRSSTDDPQLSPRLVDRSGTSSILSRLHCADANVNLQRLHLSNHERAPLAMPTLFSKTTASKPAKYRSPLACFVTTRPRRPGPQRVPALTASKVLLRHLLRRRRNQREKAKTKKRIRKVTRNRAACSLGSSRVRRRTRRAPVETRAR